MKKIIEKLEQFYWDLFREDEKTSIGMYAAILIFIYFVVTITIAVYKHS